MAITLESSDVLQAVSVIHEFERVSGVREFILAGVDDILGSSRPFTALASDFIPKIGDPWENHAEGYLTGPTLSPITFDSHVSCVCFRRTCVPLDASNKKFRITCSYGWVDAVTGPAQDPNAEPNPAEGRPYARYSFGTSLQTVEASQGKEGPVSGAGPYASLAQMKVGYASPVDAQPPEQTVSVTKQEPVISFTFQRHEDRSPTDSGFESYVGKLNSLAFNNQDAGTVLLVRISAEPQFGRGGSNRNSGSQSYITTYEFQAIPNSLTSSLAFDVEATLKDANGKDIVGPVDDETKKRFRLYDEADFNDFNLLKP